MKDEEKMVFFLVEGVLYFPLVNCQPSLAINQGFQTTWYYMYDIRLHEMMKYETVVIRTQYKIIYERSLLMMYYGRDGLSKRQEARL